MRTWLPLPPSSAGATTESGELRLAADVGLPSAKPLLQLAAERLARLQLMAAEGVAGAGAGIANLTHWCVRRPSKSRESWIWA